MMMLNRWVKHLFFRCPKATLTIAILLIGIYCIQLIAGETQLTPGMTFREALTWTFGLTPSLVLRGFFWQPITYAWLHGSLLHLSLNVIILIRLGFLLEKQWGARRFLTVFLVSIVGGGVAWWAELYLHPPVPIYRSCIGISAGVAGLIGAIAYQCSQKQFSFRCFGREYILPRWGISIVMICSCLIEYVWLSQSVAVAAHIGGVLSGYVYMVCEQWYRKVKAPSR